MNTMVATLMRAGEKRSGTSRRNRVHRYVNYATPRKTQPGANSLYRNLVEASPDAIVLVAPDGTIQLANSRAAMLHGFASFEEMTGVNIFGLIAHEEHQVAIERLGKTVELGSIHNIEHNLFRTDGSTFPAELSLSVVRNPTGQPEAFICVVRDISERKKDHDEIDRLFKDLQRTNNELALTYDATLEGWIDALDLRDKETEGHSQRVTRLSLQLARLMGVSEGDLVHIRRGALLHDIGKIGIPDSILLKPGSLSDAEWSTMRMHPVYAYELLAPIPFLRPALDIPYYHHERWDGTGYPRGLAGEDIPLSARIFAVVDVWDALTSDRPYRAAWSEEKARDYIRTQVGTHFDPDVVEIFLNIDLPATTSRQTKQLGKDDIYQHMNR